MKNFFGESGAKVIETLDPLFQKTFPLHYQASTDLMKFLKYYTGVYKEEEAYEKPKTTEVLSQNMELVQNKIDEVLNPQGQRANGEIELLFKKSFEKLKEVPLKYSLAKFNRVVKEIARSLGKKARFNLQGDQVSLSPEKVHDTRKFTT